MAQTYSPTPGKLSFVKIFNHEFSFDGYTWDGGIELLPATAFTSRGYFEGVDGIVRGAYLVTGVWDGDQNPFSDAPTLDIGSIVEDVEITIRAGVLANAPTAWVVNYRIVGEAAGKVLYAIQLVADWQFNDFDDTPAGAQAENAPPD